MKIAITADVHLATRSDHPERYNALEDILGQLVRMQIAHLVIAGDLFDKGQQDYSDFEALCDKPDYKDISLHIIPGNHDPDISGRSMVAKNVTIYTKPAIWRPDPADHAILFLPYEDHVTMGEKIAVFHSDLQPRKWVLVAHGDYYEGQRQVNEYDDVAYMSLTRHDLNEYKPAAVFLGHIHKFYSADRVWYAGSPCGLDISETGRRRFLVYDTSTGEVKSCPVKTEVLWFDESLVVIPVENEAEFIREKLEGLMEAWGLEDEDKSKVRVRVKLTGYSANRKALSETVKGCLAGYTFHDEGPDISEVLVSDDEQRRAIALRALTAVREQERPSGPGEPNEDMITRRILDTIYKKE